MPHVAAFVLVAALIIMTPGPDMALVTHNALSRGRRAALLTAAGVTAGLIVWTAASAAGIAAVLRASATAFTVVKLVGAAYLVAFGVSALLSARRGSAEDPSRADDHRRRPLPRPGRSAFTQGLLCNLLNPKIAVLFTSLIPQFVTPGPAAAADSAGLAALFIAMGLIWLTGYALVASAANSLLRRPRVQRTLRAVTGTALIGLAARLATEAR